MHWEQLPEVIDAWTAKAETPAQALRKAAAGIFTRSHVGYYFDPETEKTALYAPLVSPQDKAWCKAAAERALGHNSLLFLSYQDLEQPEGRWIKVAYSDALRRTGELLNFFPGQYPGGIPTHPSPLAAMLTTGLVGGGLGYGLGTLGEKVLPQGYGRKLKRTGAILGALAGAAPGLAWGLTNKGMGNNFNDPSLLDAPAGSEPVNYPQASQGSNMAPQSHAPDPYSAALGQAAEQVHTGLHLKNGLDALLDVPLGKRYQRAIDVFLKHAYWESPERPPSSVVDVNIDSLGHTLWENEASPSLTAATLGSVYAAQQLPDPHARQGWVTGNQLGQLAASTAGDYGKGLLVGAVLNAAVGTPYRASTFGAAGAALGLISAVVPKLWGG